MNKFKITVFIFLILTIFSVSKVYAHINNYNLLGKVIYLDPGHGGRDSGATSKNILEKDINLIISKKIEKELIAKGATVYLTREKDIDLSTTSNNKKRSDLTNRAKLINNSNTDMYVSIHLNYITSSIWKGLQIFYTNKNKENKNIANSITAYLKEKSKNIREPKEENSYYMYKQITKPGILIELGFLSNPSDRYQLTTESYQNKLSINISNAIENYLLNK